VVRAFQMSSERCWRLGLILSELITNSARHAFRDSGGLIRVELLPSRAFVECRVTDNGVGEANIRRGRGLEIVEGLTKSLQGSIDQHFGPQGETSVLIIPLCPRMHQQAVETQRDHPEPRRRENRPACQGSNSEHPSARTPQIRVGGSSLAKVEFSFLNGNLMEPVGRRP
jgi:hypothetical protein